jgi:hypothetical protein
MRIGSDELIRANAHQGSVPDLGERWPSRLVATAEANCFELKHRPLGKLPGGPFIDDCLKSTSSLRRRQKMLLWCVGIERGEIWHVRPSRMVAASTLIVVLARFPLSGAKRTLLSKRVMAAPDSCAMPRVHHFERWRARSLSG